MTTSINTISGWNDLNEAVAAASEAALEILSEEPWSDDDESAYVQAERALLALNKLSDRIAAMAMQEIDDEIAESGLVDEINALAKEAKDEANAIKVAADKVTAFADLVGKIAGIVTKVAGLF